MGHGAKPQNVLQTDGAPPDVWKEKELPHRGILSLSLYYNYITCVIARSARGVTERDHSLHSGMIDSVQNVEAELRHFEAQ